MTDDLDALRDELKEFAQPKKNHQRSPREERIIAGFEDIRRFVEQHGHTPRHGEDNDIFERLYAVRLDRLRQLDETDELLGPLDHQGILQAVSESQVDASVESLDDDALMEELAGKRDESTDLSKLTHVRSNAEKRPPEEVATRQRCPDFDAFQPLFEQVERELQTGERQARPFRRDAAINEGEFFIVGGQMAYVAHVGAPMKAPNGSRSARLRVIYDNGTESNLLLWSLQRALYKDEAGRRITDSDAGPLFGDSLDEGDVETGTIYVLRSHSDHPYVAENRDLIHKIGVTGGKVETRIANAADQSTYLLADVEVVATYKLAGINRVKLENLLHRVLAPAQLDLTIEDRFGKPVKPREWFLVPLFILEEVIDRIRAGSITEVVYDPSSAGLVLRDG